MTIILTCLTPNCVMQASDQRLVRFSPRRPGPVVSNEEMKAVVLGNSQLVAYTGWARLEGDSSAMWFASQMQPYVDSGMYQDGFNVVARRLEDIYRRSPFLLKASLSFVVTGFIERKDGCVYPVLTQVTNAIGGDLRRFGVYRVRLKPNAPATILAIGAPVPVQPIYRANRIVKTLVRRNSQPVAMGRVLVELLQSFAKLHGPGGVIGSSCMLAALPVEAVRTYADPFLGPPIKGRLTMLRVPGPEATGMVDIGVSAVMVNRGLPVILQIQAVMQANAEDYDPWRISDRELTLEVKTGKGSNDPKALPGTVTIPWRPGRT